MVANHPRTQQHSRVVNHNDSPYGKLLSDRFLVFHIISDLDRIEYSDAGCVRTDENSPRTFQAASMPSQQHT